MIHPQVGAPAIDPQTNVAAGTDTQSELGFEVDRLGERKPDPGIDRGGGQRDDAIRGIDGVDRVRDFVRKGTDAGGPAVGETILGILNDCRVAETVAVYIGRAKRIRR